MNDQDLARERLVQEVEKLNLHPLPKKWPRILIISISLAITLILVIVGVVIRNQEEGKISLFLYIAAFIVFAIGIIVFVILTSKKNALRTKNNLILDEHGESLYRFYYDNDAFFDRNEIEFTGFSKNKKQFNWAMNFKIKDEEISFNVIEESSEVLPSRAIKNNSKNSLFYSLQYDLESSASKLKDFDFIKIVQGVTPKGHIQGFYTSESLAFNKNHLVIGNNEKQMYQLFKPYVINQFIKLGDDYFVDKTIYLEDGVIHAYFDNPRTKLPGYSPQLLDFSAIDWSRKTINEDVASKISLDFARYIQLQKIIFPLDVYDLKDPY